MSAMSSAGKIVVYFGWKGPTTSHGGWQKGGLDVGSIDLIFQEARTRVSVILPDRIDPALTNRISFTCRRPIGESSFANETHPNALSLTIEQVRHLKLNAAFLEKSPVSNWTMMDQQGRITREERILRTDQKVGLTIPDNLEAGKTYLLEVTSKDLSLSARLVEEQPEDPSYDQYKLELFQLIGGVLLPLMGMKMAEFSIKLMDLPEARNFIASPNINPKTIGTSFIQKEIDQIDKQTLKELAEKLRQAKATLSNKSLEDRISSEKEIVKACFNALGPNSLQGIMRSNLERIIRSEITPGMRALIESISARFQEICLGQIMG